MNFNTSVDIGTVDAILESALWKKAYVKVGERKTISESSEENIDTIPEYSKGVANVYEEPQTIDNGVDQEAELRFSLDDLQTVLDNLEEDDLMEHALSMLEVFDVAYESLQEEEEESDEEEEEEEESDGNR